MHSIRSILYYDSEGTACIYYDVAPTKQLCTARHVKGAHNGKANMIAIHVQGCGIVGGNNHLSETCASQLSST
eukprot:5370159-Pleurochrysis_carterae.AAC.1